MGKKKMAISILANMAFLVIYFVLLRLSNTVSISHSESNYFTVRFPVILSWVAHISVVGGVCFSIVFIIKYLKNDPKITLGHFIIGGIFVLIGIILQIVYVKWSIIIDGNRIIFNRIFKQQVQYNIEDLDAVNMTGDIIKITVDGKIITYVDKETDNFDKLCHKLAERRVTKY